MSKQNNIRLGWYVCSCLMSVTSLPLIFIYFIQFCYCTVSPFHQTDKRQAILSRKFVNYAFMSSSRKRTLNNVQKIYILAGTPNLCNHQTTLNISTSKSQITITQQSLFNHWDFTLRKTPAPRHRGPCQIPKQSTVLFLWAKWCLVRVFFQYFLFFRYYFSMA